MQISVPVTFDATNQTMSVSDSSLITFPQNTSDFSIVTVNGMDCITPTTVSTANANYVTFVLANTVTEIEFDSYITIPSASWNWNLWFELVAPGPTYYSLTYEPQGNWHNPDGLSCDLATGTWYTIKVTSTTVNIYNKSNGTLVHTRSLVGMPSDLSIANFIGSTSYLANLVLKRTINTDLIRYANTSGIAEIWANIKNWVSAHIGNGTLTIQKNGTNVTTFSANSSSNATANITVPTKVSDLTNDSGFLTTANIPSKTSDLVNDSGFLTSHQSLSNYVTLDSSQILTATKNFTTNINTSSTSTTSRETWRLVFKKDSADTDSTAAAQIGLIQGANNHNFAAVIRLANPRANNKPTTGNTSNCWSGIGVYYNYDENKGYPYALYCWDWPTSSNSTNELASTSWVRTYCETTKGFLTSHQSLSNYVTLDGAETISGNKTFTGTLTGDITGNCSGSSGSCTGNAATANKLVTARNIALGNEFMGSSNFDGSENITINGSAYLSVVSIGNKNNYPYHCFAKFGPITSTYQDAAIKLLVSRQYINGGTGIIELEFRTNSTNQDGECAVRWITRSSKIPVDCIQVGFYKTWGGIYADVFYKSRGAYDSCVIRSMGDGSRASYERRFTLQDSNEVNNTTTSDPLTSVNSYASIAAAGTALHNQAYTDTITATDNGVVGSANACTGNAATATQFSANKAVTLTGDVTGTASSKAGWSVATTLANSGVTAGTYGPSADVTGNNNSTISVPQITVDAKGRVTSVVNRTLTCKNNTYSVYNKTLTIQKNGTNVATFTSNSNTDVTANITVPTKTSELTNDSGFLTNSALSTNFVTTNTAQTISGAKTFTANVNVPALYGTSASFSYGLDTGCIEMNVSQGRSDGGYIDFHYNQSTADFTSRIIENASGQLDINGIKFRSDASYLGVSIEGDTVDLNDLYSTIKGATRIYYATTNGGTNNITNKPVGQAFTLYSHTVRRQSASDYVIEQLAYSNQTIYFRACVNGTWTAWKTISFSDHTHSQYLTAHQSLANYVTLNSAQTITNQKIFTIQPAVMNTAYQIGTTPSSNLYTFMEFFDKNAVQTGWIGRVAYTNGYGNMTISCGDRFTNGAKAANGTGIGSWLEVGLTPAGGQYLNTNAGWWCSVWPAIDNTVDLGTASLKWRNLFTHEVHCYNQNALMSKSGSYTFLLRNDGSSIWFLISEANGAEGTWSGLRPLYINCASGACISSSNWTFNKSFGDGDPSVLIQSGTAYANGTWNYPLSALAPNMKAGSNLFMPIGRSHSTGNCAGWHFHYAGDNSNDNCLTAEFYAAGSPLAVYKDGRVMLSSTPATSDNSNRVATTAFVKANAYTHPTTAGNKHIPSGGSSGQILKYSASGTAVWADASFTRQMVSIDTDNNTSLPRTKTVTLTKSQLAVVTVDLTTLTDYLVKLNASNVFVVAIRTLVGNNVCKQDSVNYGNILQQGATGRTRVVALIYPYNTSVEFTLARVSGAGGFSSYALAVYQ